jgi:alkylation response protein AidB-like acyl-CoA dehydrogenase
MTSTTADLTELARELGPTFASRCAKHDADDSFVAENYAELKARRAFAAGVPEELGGGGASHAQLCHFIRELAHHCSSTALALSMHSHLIATLSYVWRSGNKAPEGLLKRVASEQLVLISTGGSDWLPGSGKLEKVEGGFRLSGRKIFGSGVPAGDLLMTTGIYEDPVEGPTVYHLPVSVKAEGVKILDTWHAHGMRGTGSHDIQLENVFVPDASAQGVRRKAGKWHPFMHAVVLVAFPVFYAAYVGVAEAARAAALTMASRKKNDPNTGYLLGELEEHLVSAQLAHASMLDVAQKIKPGAEATAAQLTRRGILVNGCVRTVEKALEAAGGASFFRDAPLERLWRDVQGARFHPVTDKPRAHLVGRHMLGLDLDLS